ncbi:Fpg/Nei family DNA glycosylase [Jiangella sp. DSM 45060]|uniref:Fpg/Nei family DNA glycosylase n=1 Tax=Jiangella sp. DSM 45060 TaxID=1798224 RepID=UPI00087DA63C|nr:DNA-formamidopyrimidine glycosylase family protein [Jiangella sp. DSM 45060]SDT49253.1 endonuclease-8 [Jiangella sp. DSM 45060]
MPEGHTIHRLADDVTRAFGGRVVGVSSPQGRFAAGAAVVSGSVLSRAEAHGKHLFIGFAGRRWVHVHLGLYGKFDVFSGAPPAGPVVGQVRMRLVAGAAAAGRAAAGSGYADLRGPTRCEVVGDAEKDAVAARLGPDPLRGDDPGRALERIGRSRAPIGVLLMDQAVVAGVGNVYRAESLFRAGVDPARTGASVPEPVLRSIWADLVGLMELGVKTGRIDTVRPEHEPEAMGRPPRVDDHGGEVYVYRRTGQPCLVCGTPVAAGRAAARNLFWCPNCQH